jgi:hypothetical protein
MVVKVGSAINDQIHIWLRRPAYGPGKTAFKAPEIVSPSQLRSSRRGFTVLVKNG